MSNNGSAGGLIAGGPLPEGPRGIFIDGDRDTGAEARQPPEKARVEREDDHRLVALDAAQDGAGRGVHLATARAPASWTSVTTTRAPRRPSSSQRARPRPEAPPVTTATASRNEVAVIRRSSWKQVGGRIASGLYLQDRLGGRTSGDET